MRAIRVFISSLFSKRLLLMIIVALVIMLLHLNVHAESIYQDGYIYRNIVFNGLNEEDNSYSWTYRVYLKNGIYEGSVFLPSDLYNQNHYVLYLNNNGVPELFINGSKDKVYWYTLPNSSKDSLSNTLGSYSLANFSLYRFENNSWVLKDSGTKNVDKTLDMQPNSILFSKNLTVYYCDLDNRWRKSLNYMVNHSDGVNHQILKVPELKLRPNIRF